MVAHIAGVPVEELLVLAVGAGGAALSLLRARLRLVAGRCAARLRR